MATAQDNTGIAILASTQFFKIFLETDSEKFGLVIRSSITRDEPMINPCHTRDYPMTTRDFK